jgi:tRNA1(Val) A37 N6-methylase TrmN6
VGPLDLLVRPDEHCAALTRDFRVIQRVRGHRYSVDDLLVAHLACAHASGARRVLDLGCGIGSVLLMVAWAMPGAELVGLEAQPESAALARRNVALNGCEQRARVVLGDLRDLALVGSLGRFELVAAAPPYFDPRAATPCHDPQRAQARFEMRGGVEAFARAAAAVLSTAGLFVACAAASPRGRTDAALDDAGLRPVWRRCVLPRPDRDPFLELVVAAPDSDAEPPAQSVAVPPLVLRELDGRRTREHAAIREWFGLRASER